MASFQIHLDSKFADLSFDKNACMWHLADPVYLPSDKYEFLVNVSAASIPLSHHVIAGDNNLLQLLFPSGATEIRIPAGNRSIDEVIAYVNSELEGSGYTIAYDEATNKASLATEAIGASVSIGEGTTCERLLGFVPGQTAPSPSPLVAERGVDLSGTSSIFVRSNLLTRNRDPVTKAVSNILAKVHVSRNFYEIEYFSSQQRFAISDRSVTMIVVYLTDDAQHQIDLNGADYSISLEFAVRERPVITHARDYRLSGITTNVPQPLPNPSQAAKPADEAGDGGGSERGPGGDRGSGRGAVPGQGGDQGP